jgi:hypothetical protein
MFSELGGLAYRPGSAPHDHPLIGRPTVHPVPAQLLRAVPQDPGQVADLGVGVDLPVGAQGVHPRRFGQFPDPGHGPLVAGPPDRVLHPAAAAAVGAGSVQLRQMCDELTGGAGPVDGDQDVGAPRGGDLSQGGVHDQDVVGGGVRAGVARAEHHGQAVSDIRAPRRQRMEPESTPVD